MPVDAWAKFPAGTHISGTEVEVPGRPSVKWDAGREWLSCLGDDFVVARRSVAGEVTVVIYEAAGERVFELGWVFGGDEVVRCWLMADCFLVSPFPDLKGRHACNTVRYDRRRQPRYYESNLCLPVTWISYLFAEPTGRYFVFFDHESDCTVVMDSRKLTAVHSSKGVTAPRELFWTRGRLMLRSASSLDPSVRREIEIPLG